ncbi:MAG: phosphate acetyltransferase [Alphaproteobacteria bacterium]
MAELGKSYPICSEKSKSFYRLFDQFVVYYRQILFINSLRTDQMTESAYLKRLLAKAAENLKTIVLPESEDDRVLDAAHFVAEAGAARPVILGSPETVEGYYRGKGWSMEGIEVISPENSPRLAAYAEMFFELRKDKGVTAEDALKQMHNYNYFGTMMIKAGDADGMVSGANHSTADTVRPALQIIKSAKKGRAVSSAVLEVVNGKPYILSDCAIVINPTAAELADIAVDAAQTALQFGIEPNVALLSYSTKGSGKGEGVDKVAEAARLAGEQLKLPEYKDLPIKIDGEMQADAALDAVVAAKKAPGSEVAGQANVLIFPDIEAGNISYKLLQRLGGAEAYGPILQGLNAPVNDLSRGALVEDIVGMIAITALQAAKK